MSMFGDYKAYKKYEPNYAAWKQQRNIQEAKRIEYIKQNPNKINDEDIQRGKILLRSINVMDEYSQKYAEDAEVGTNNVISIALSGGLMLGVGLSLCKSTNKLLSKFTKNKKNSAMAQSIFGMTLGVIISTILGFPLYAWAAKTEVKASKQGRFEAMRKELQNPNSFAVLTPEQKDEVNQIAQNIKLPKKKENSLFNISTFSTLKKIIIKDKEYAKQKSLFDLELKKAAAHINDDMSPEDIVKAKKDQQLLTKLVEKIDIASQDYAENAEVCANTLITSLLAGTILADLGITKLMNLMKIKSAKTVSAAIKVAGFGTTLLASIMAANISKEASRIGRYKIKKELMKHPESFIYVDDKEIENMPNIKAPEQNKQGILTFLKNVYKDAKEYNKYKKDNAQNEARYFKATEQIKLTPEQLKDAKRLQKNTFTTFNKVDENSQKYSESIEALGQAISQPLILISSFIGTLIAMPYLMKPAKTSIQRAENLSKYIGIIFLSTIPSIIIDMIITKKQKQASRIADMQAINDMQDYRQFK